MVTRGEECVFQVVQLHPHSKKQVLCFAVSLWVFDHHIRLSSPAMTYCMISSSSSSAPISEHSRLHKLTPLWTILRTHPRCVETKVMRLKVELDCTEPCPPWSTCPASPIRWRTIDGCSKNARVVLWWFGSRKMSKQTKSSLCDYCKRWLGLTCSTPHFFIGDMRRIWNMYYTVRRRHHWSNASRRRLEATVILHVSAPSRRIGSMHTLYRRILVCKLLEDRQMLRSSDFIHERAFSILLQISGSLPPCTCMQDPRQWWALVN